jgi:SAM-dependent methyltransferase
MTDMYEHSVAAYEVLHAARGKDYAAEASAVAERIRRHRPLARTLLDVACGTGLHLAAFRDLGFAVEGLDLSDAMVAAARARLPESPIHRADMRSFALGRRFDAAVCLFSAIGYMTTLDDLAVALGTVRNHLVPGGVLVVEPWFEPDGWHDGYVFAEGATSRGLGVARVTRSWREGSESVIEMRYALATAERTWAFQEVHRMGLHTIEQQLLTYRAAGFSVEHQEPGITGRGLFVAVAPD